MPDREVRYCSTEDGVRIAYTVQGSGPLMVMTPFWMESFSLLHIVPEAEAFVRRLQEVRRVVLYDFRGTGLSQRDVTFERFTTRFDLEAVIAALGGGPVTLWSQSVWTPMCLRLVAEKPHLFERLVIAAGMAAIRPIYPKERTDMFATLVLNNWAMACQAFGDMSTREADPEAGIRWGRLYRESSTPEAVASLLRSEQEDATDCLPHITVPTLILHRKGDLVVPIDFAREMAAQIPDALLVPLDGVMTAPFLGDQEQVLRAALPFLGGEATAFQSDRDTAVAAVRTVLFTDLVGHTEMMSRLGDERGRDVLREHERITREVLKTHGGTEVKTMGDGFMASFGSVTKAVECAVALQRAFADWNAGVGRDVPPERLYVRVGLNAGEPIEEDGDLFGATVILASRIAAKAGGGEILVADTVRGLCSGKGFLFSDRGEFVAKGIEEPVRVYEVRWRNET